MDVKQCFVVTEERDTTGTVVGFTVCSVANDLEDARKSLAKLEPGVYHILKAMDVGSEVVEVPARHRVVTGSRATRANS